MFRNSRVIQYCAGDIQEVFSFCNCSHNYYVFYILWAQIVECMCTCLCLSISGNSTVMFRCDMGELRDFVYTRDASV